MTKKYQVEFRVKRPVGPLFETRFVPVQYEDDGTPESALVSRAKEDAELRT